MPPGISLVVPATPLHRTSSPSSGFSENLKSISLSILFWQGLTSPGKRLLEKASKDPWGLSSRILLLWVVEPCIRGWRSSGWELNFPESHYKAGSQKKKHSWQASLLSTPSIFFHLTFFCTWIAQGRKCLSEENPTNAAKSTEKKKGAKSKQLCPMTV